MKYDDTTFEKVKELVGKGFSISEACKKIGISPSTLYLRMNDNQKVEIKHVKTSNALYHNKRLY